VKDVFDLVFPEPQHFPTLRGECRIHFGIPRHVSLNLSNPKRPVRVNLVLRLFPTISVPKMAVENNATFLLGKAKSGFPSMS